MPLVEHLLELRRRAMISALAVIAAGVLGFFLSEVVLEALSSPLKTIDGRLATINFPSVTSAFDVRIEIALVVGLVISSPVWLFQIFAFLTPAFTRQEKKYVFGFFFSAVPLFLVGCGAGFFIIPHVVALMVGFAVPGSSSLVDAKDYLDFALRLILAIGIAFVLPVFLVLLNFAGVLSGKAILKAWRLAILAITIFTGIATPAADIISMLLLAAPMVVLYFAAVGISLAHDRRKARRDAAILEGSSSL